MRVGKTRLALLYEVLIDELVVVFVIVALAFTKIIKRFC